MATVTDRTTDTSFSDEELDHLHSDDLHAASLVVGLMTGVFTIGLLMYAAICVIAMM